MRPGVFGGGGWREGFDLVDVYIYIYEGRQAGACTHDNSV